MSELLQDLRFAARQLRRSPGFTVAAIACLALGIGANTVAFGLAWEALFDPPPVEAPGRLVRLFASWENGRRFAEFSYPDFLDVQEGSREVLETLTADRLVAVHLSSGGRNQRVWASMVSMNYFTGLGVPMALGQGFSPSSGEVPGSVPLVVLTHRVWERQFGQGNRG